MASCPTKFSSPTTRSERNQENGSAGAKNYSTCASTDALIPRCHGLAPWRVTFVATLRRRSSAMPRPCAVEGHVRCYTPGAGLPRCHGLAPWRVTFVATLAASVNLPGARPWHQVSDKRESPQRRLATSVNLPGARPWHPQGDHQTTCTGGNHSLICARRMLLNASPVDRAPPLVTMRIIFSFGIWPMGITLPAMLSGM